MPITQADIEPLVALAMRSPKEFTREGTGGVAGFIKAHPQLHDAVQRAVFDVQQKTGISPDTIGTIGGAFIGPIVEHLGRAVAELRVQADRQSPGAGLGLPGNGAV